MEYDYGRLCLQVVCCMEYDYFICPMTGCVHMWFAVCNMTIYYDSMTGCVYRSLAVWNMTIFIDIMMGCVYRWFTVFGI